MAFYEVLKVVQNGILSHNFNRIFLEVEALNDYFCNAS